MIESNKDKADDYVAFCRYTNSGAIVTCDSDAPKAFKVYRHPEPMPMDFEKWADEKGITEITRWWARESWNEAIRQR